MLGNLGIAVSGGASRPITAWKIGDTYSTGWLVATIAGINADGTLKAGSLLVSSTDLSAGTAWSNITDQSSGATGTALGTGTTNTALIIGQTGHTSSAASLCVAAGGVLPSRDELVAMAPNRAALGFGAGLYASSTEFSSTYYVYVNMSTLVIGNNLKTTNGRVKAIKYI